MDASKKQVITINSDANNPIDIVLEKNGHLSVTGARLEGNIEDEFPNGVVPLIESIYVHSIAYHYLYLTPQNSPNPILMNLNPYPLGVKTIYSGGPNGHYDVEIDVTKVPKLTTTVFTTFKPFFFNIYEKNPFFLRNWETVFFSFFMK